MESAGGKALWMLLATGFFISGCQTGQELSGSTLSDAGEASNERSAVAEELGPVAVLKKEFQYFSKPNVEAKQHVMQAGYEVRGAVNELKLRHLDGTTASALYFTELKDDGIGAGAVKIRNSGHSRAIIRIDGGNVGECTILEPVVGLQTISYARPVALDDGEQVPIGSVRVGPRQFDVISKCRHNGEQGAVSVFFSGRNRTIWNDYEIDGRVVAKRSCPPDEAIEFSPELSAVEQICIAADMHFRLWEDRVSERQRNTVYIPVYY
jgi:hypothetical protein